MKSLSLVLLFALCACVFAKPQQYKEYTTKYDNIDLDQILKSDRLLASYMNCLLDKSRCTKDGEELKKILPDALHTGCSKCNEVQKTGAKKVIHFLIEKKPELWKELEAKYDPEGTYKQKYESEMKA